MGPSVLFFLPVPQGLPDQSTAWYYLLVFFVPFLTWSWEAGGLLLASLFPGVWILACVTDGWSLASGGKYVQDQDTFWSKSPVPRCLPATFTLQVLLFHEAEISPQACHPKDSTFIRKVGSKILLFT